MIRIAVASMLCCSALLAQAPAQQQKFTPVQATPFTAEAATLSVGDASVDASKIKPYRVQWKETFATPANQILVIGTWTDQVERTTIDGISVLKRTVTVDRPQRNIHATTTLLVDGRTFAPLMTEEMAAGKPADLHFDFRGKHLAGMRRDDDSGVEHPIKADLPLSAFDTLGGMTDLFPATLPLRSGYAVRFPNFSATISADADPASITWITLRVKRQDTVALPDGTKVKAWLVDSDTPLGFYKVWIAEQPPYIVRTIWVGPGGGRSIFELMPAGES